MLQYILNYVYEDNKWIEQQQYDMRYPVFTINYIDITNQGIKDAVVMTEKGIHILKVNYISDNGFKKLNI